MSKDQAIRVMVVTALSGMAGTLLLSVVAGPIAKAGIGATGQFVLGAGVGLGVQYWALRNYG
jgi:hypothetical protein